MLVSSFCASRRETRRRMSETELVYAAPSQQRLRRSSSSSAAAAPQPCTQMIVSSSRPSSRCCWQHLKKGRGGNSRRDASYAQHQLRRSSIRSVAAAAPRGGTLRQLEEGRELRAASAPLQQQQIRCSSTSWRRQCPATMSGRRGLFL
jgi:hypothetical protein